MTFSKLKYFHLFAKAFAMTFANTKLFVSACYSLHDFYRKPRKANYFADTDIWSQTSCCLRIVMTKHTCVYQTFWIQNLVTKNYGNILHVFFANWLKPIHGFHGIISLYFANSAKKRDNDYNCIFKIKDLFDKKLLLGYVCHNCISMPTENIFGMEASLRAAGRV